MKLLSRFIWLIVGISAILFAAVTTYQIMAENEFELIKNSIKEEYDVQVDKMLTPDRYGVGITSYLSDISNDASSSIFMEGAVPDAYFVENYLHPDILKYNDVDAVWFYKTEGQAFYFKSNSNLLENSITITKNELLKIFGKKEITPFYSVYNDEIIYYQGAAINNSQQKNVGYVAMASKIDDRWIKRFTSAINNSVITVSKADETLPEIDDKTIRITRELKGYDQSTVALLNVELHLPFLSLWNKTNSADKWLLTGSITIIVIFLIFFLIFWVISPLKKISSSLTNSHSKDIEPLLKGKTEMGEIARMIGDYHLKTQELEASESIKRHIIDQAQVGIIIAEAESGLILTINPFACELIKAPEEAATGNVTANFLEPTNTETHGSEGYESILFNSKNEEITILRTSTKMMMNGGQVIMDTFVDLSEIKSLQNKLEDEKKKMSLAVQNSGLTFCEYDFKTDVFTIDKSWDFLSKGNSKNRRENIRNKIYESDKKEIKSKFDTLENGIKDTLAAEFRIEHPERGLIWMSLSVLITKRDDEHKPKQLIGLIEDITERISTQQELIKAKEKAEESDRVKSSYLGNMSHKIRTPLNAIVGFADLLAEEDLETEEKGKFIDIIRHDTEQVLHLIDDIIYIAKIDANKLDNNNKPVSINKIVDNLNNYYKANEKTKTINFSIKTMLPDGQDIINTDEDKLHQALDNLLNNAFKYTTKGTIELGYYINPVDHKLIMYVKDTGIGISKDSKDKILNRFYQVNPMSEGTGLGLSISNSMAKLIGAKLYFDSTIDVGSTFYIEIPQNEF